MAKTFPASQKHGSQRGKSPVKPFLALEKAGIMLVISIQVQYTPARKKMRLISYNSLRLRRSSL
jgi:hypothetical protein